MYVWFQCSYDICLETFDRNKDKVDIYKKKWLKKVSQKMECFYNTENHNILIQTKQHTKHDVIHSMLWPSVVIIICGVIFLKLEMDRRRLTCCGKQDDTENNLDDKSHQFGSRSCNGKNNDSLPASSVTPPSRTGGASGGNLHRSLEHLSNYSTNKTDYHSTANCSKSLSCLDHLGKNGHSSSKGGSKQQLLKQQPAHIQATCCTDTGKIKNKVLKSNTVEQTQCLIPEIKIDDFGSSESQTSNHHETPVWIMHVFLLC